MCSFYLIVNNVDASGYIKRPRKTSSSCCSCSLAELKNPLSEQPHWSPLGRI